MRISILMVVFSLLLLGCTTNIDITYKQLSGNPTHGEIEEYKSRFSSDKDGGFMFGSISQIDSELDFEELGVYFDSKNASGKAYISDLYKNKKYDFEQNGDRGNLFLIWLPTAEYVIKRAYYKKESGGISVKYKQLATFSVKKGEITYLSSIRLKANESENLQELSKLIKESSASKLSNTNIPIEISFFEEFARDKKILREKYPWLQSS